MITADEERMQPERSQTRPAPKHSDETEERGHAHRSAEEAASHKLQSNGDVRVPVSAEDELQLHDDEGTAQINRKRHHYDAATKLEAVNWARYNRSAKSGNYNVLASSKKYKVDRKRIRQWISQEEQLKQQINTPGGSKRKKLDGGGRHVIFPELDVQMAEWIRDKRENKQPVTRLDITV
uniref:Brinker DNA-binding domain-containing protein n=1 Tax=Ditylenchus dipsaci TaxID=166011 RepID=A0A915CLR4_9BILA